MANNYNGIVNVYKEKGFTSFDVVAKLRGIFGQKKIGHTGTLDPDAVGVLPICLGNGTKVVELLMDHDKEYMAELLLGMSTDTQDTTGEVVNKASETDLELLSEDKVKEAVNSFMGDIEQIPPMYSALKVNGQKLCDLARKGVEVERKPRKITVHEIELLEIKLPVVKMRVHCSKGTYIRTLCNDIGEKLGVYGCMQSLERTRVGIFGKEEALTLPQIQSLKDEGKLGEIVRPVDGLFPDYPKMKVTDEALYRLENGNVLTASELVEADDYVNLNSNPKEINTVKVQSCVRVYRPDMTFAGIYKKHEDGLYKSEKMFL
ncbi:MAG: tRNA pseudouridine(55) synthase TruB [Lachnospiraceae bacterium]|nr:tRNA pseudouridine(55) synthase TruB [Lachnospiraceae bacterium]